MTPAEITRTINTLRRDLAALTDERVRRQDALAKALTVEPHFYNDRDVSDAREALSRTDREIANATERADALNASLPTPEVQAAAKAHAKALHAVAVAACAECPSRWAAVASALDAAEVAARDYRRVRSAAEMAIAALTQAVRDNGLGIAVPPMPSPDATQSELARHQVMLLMNIAEGVEVDPIVDKYVALFRSRLAALVPA